MNVNGVNIVNSSHTKFLGIVLDEYLIWKHHVNTVMDRVKTNKKLLTNAKNLLNAKTLKGVYHMHTYSHLTYCLVVWGSMINCQLREDLYKVQKQCIHVIAKIGPRADISSIFESLHTLPFPDMIKLELAKLGYKVE